MLRHLKSYKIIFFWLTSPQSSPHLPTDGPVAEQIVGGRVLVRHNKDDYCDDGEDDCDDPLSLSFAQGVDKQQHFRVGKLHLVDLAGRLFGHKTSLQFRQLTKNYHFCWSCQSCYVRSKNHFCLCKLQTNSCSNDFLSQAFPS